MENADIQLTLWLLDITSSWPLRFQAPVTYVNVLASEGKDKFHSYTEHLATFVTEQFVTYLTIRRQKNYIPFRNKKYK
jgi:hypothetical protein